MLRDLRRVGHLRAPRFQVDRPASDVFTWWSPGDAAAWLADRDGRLCGLDPVSREYHQPIGIGVVVAQAFNCQPAGFRWGVRAWSYDSDRGDVTLTVLPVPQDRVFDPHDWRDELVAELASKDASGVPRYFARVRGVDHFEAVPVALEEVFGEEAKVAVDHVERLIVNTRNRVRRAQRKAEKSEG
jgi:hypothetical protein